ncbi:MAG: hypothetical protein K2Q06_04115 [Parvularculaceae bacterium]|nr:hypothetical protein [Parvularculaceae bacterium]
MKRHVALLALIAALSGAAAAQPRQSLREARAQDAAEQLLASQVAYTNSVCGLTMTSGIDWATVGDWPDAALVDACDRALGAVELACRAGSRKSQIASLSRVVCAGDGSGPSLQARVFRYGAAVGVDAFEQTRAMLDALR